MKIKIVILTIMLFVCFIFFSTFHAHKTYYTINLKLRKKEIYRINSFDKFCLSLNPHDFLLNNILKYKAFNYLNSGDKMNFYLTLKYLKQIEPNNYSTNLLLNELEKDSLSNLK